MNWTFLDYQDKKYEIGLYHGTNSGNVLLYCNETIVVVDFGVLDTKNYSFYIGDELAELTIEKENKNFSYRLIQNVKTLTPLNLARIQQEKRYILYTFLLFLSLAIIIALLSYILITL
jgi:hypothetical protein